MATVGFELQHYQSYLPLLTALLSPYNAVDECKIKVKAFFLSLLSSSPKSSLIEKKSLLNLKFLSCINATMNL